MGDRGQSPWWKNIESDRARSVPIADTRIADTSGAWRAPCSGQAERALSVRIECAQARHQAAHVELQLRRERPFQRIANLAVDVDQLLGGSKFRLALAEAHARVTQESIEREELALQIRFVQRRRLQMDLRSGAVNCNVFPRVLPSRFASFQ